MKRGAPHIRGGQFMPSSSRCFLCPGCVCMAACSNDWLPDHISEPFLTQPFTKLPEQDWGYYAVYLLCFYENLKIKLLISSKGFCVCFSHKLNRVYILNFKKQLSLSLSCPIQHGVRVHSPCAPPFLRNSGGCVWTPKDSHLENNEQQI